MFSTKYTSGFVLWSGHCDEFFVSNWICNYFFCLHVLYLYMLEFSYVIIAGLQCISMLPALPSCRVFMFVVFCKLLSAFIFKKCVFKGQLLFESTCSLKVCHKSSSDAKKSKSTLGLKPQLHETFFL